MGILLGLAAAFGWGTADFLARGATRLIGTYRTLLYVQVIGFAGLGAYLLVSGELAALAASAGLADWAWGLILGLLNMVSSFALYRAFEVCRQLAIVSSIAASYAGITVLLAILSGEQLSATRGLGLALALIGVVLAAASPEPGSDARRFRLDRTILADGVGWALLASLGYGFTYWVLGFRAAPALGGVMPVWLMRLTTLFVLTTAAIVVRRPLPIPDWRTGRLLLVVGVLDTAAFVAHTIGVRTDQVSVMTVLSSTYSSVTVLLAWVFLSERLAGRQWLGIALILTAIILVSL